MGILVLMEVDNNMENKPVHYDGSAHNDEQLKNEAYSNETFELTDEMRKNISGNPYFTK